MKGEMNASLQYQMELKHDGQKNFALQKYFYSQQFILFES